MASTTTPLPHPFDPLCPLQIEKAASIVRATHGQLAYNAISLLEPRKKEMQAWLESPDTAPRPPRLVEVVCVGKCGSVFDGIVDLGKGEITVWNKLEGVQPILTLEDLVNTELYVRKDPKVIEQCGILGIPPEDMHKVYADRKSSQISFIDSLTDIAFIAWTIGYDERFGNDIRLQQALMYYRRDIDDCQYAFPLDFIPIVNTLTGEVIHIDIPEVRRPLNKVPSNYFPKHIAEDARAKGKKGDGYRTDLRPINITQPDGVSFKMDGNYIEWQNWRMHIGFNYKEGIVLRDISLNDEGTRRSLFYRMSLVEMNVPYGNPERPHQRKHAFDLGEYGGGYMTNSLA
jgi:primary-amine oxidase